MKDKRKTAQEVPVQEQLNKKSININLISMILALLGICLGIIGLLF